MLRTVSITALAAEAADDEPRAAMIAAPRCWTVVMNSPRSHASSLMTSAAAAADRGVIRVGELGRGVVAPDDEVADLGHGRARRGARAVPGHGSRRAWSSRTIGRAACPAPPATR